jgi:hypothetical protein
VVLPAGEIPDVALPLQQPRRPQLDLVSSAAISRRRFSKARTYASAGAITLWSTVGTRHARQAPQEVLERPDREDAGCAYSPISSSMASPITRLSTTPPARSEILRLASPRISPVGNSAVCTLT